MTNLFYGQAWVKLLCASAITLGNSIYFVVPQERVKNSLLWHELTHIEQINEHGIIDFYAIYLGEYLLNIAKGYNLLDAKLNISFELEATENELSCGNYCKGEYK